MTILLLSTTLNISMMWVVLIGGEIINLISLIPDVSWMRLSEIKTLSLLEKFNSKFFFVI